LGDIESAHIECFVLPVIIVDGALQLVASRSAYKQHNLLGQATEHIIESIGPLVQGRQDRISFTCLNVQFVTTSLPMLILQRLFIPSVAQQSY
jgi:hypothetical protein